MPPNFVDPPMQSDTEAESDERKGFANGPMAKPVHSNSNSYLDIFQLALTVLAHLLIGATVGGALSFVFINYDLPLTATPLHITLCVLGYHLLMAHAILSLSPNGLTRKFSHVHKRRIHWILQIGGSSLAIAGSFIKILDKSVHWNTTHGQFALVALVFTSVSLVNGLVSLYANELRLLNPRNLTKITHICFGTVGFCAASITLCFGIDKSLFRAWATDSVAMTFMSFIGLYTFIIIISPFINLFKKSKAIFRR